MQSPPSLPAPAPIRVCPGCGVIAPLARTTCVCCNTPFGAAPPVAPGGAGTAVFARVHESDFECRGCGLRSPIPLTFEGEAECLRCGLRQAFAEGQWEEAVAVAHAVADLTGPDPEGRFRGAGGSIAATNPRKTLGVEHTRAESTQSTTIIDGGGMKRLTLRISVSPGHPLCAACHAPLAIALDGRGNAQTTRCGDRATYTLPARTAEKAPMLRAVLSAEQRTDQPVAKIDAVDAAGVAAIRCPSCGAALAATAGAELATCQYCRTTARIARRAWVRASGAAPPFEPFWLLLEGPSKKRFELAGGGGEDDDDEDEDDSDPHLMAGAPTMRAPGTSSWDAQTIRTIVGLVVLVGAGLVWGGIALYQYMAQNYELGGSAPAKPVKAPARPTKR
jgi:hypothetical protein